MSRWKQFNPNPEGKNVGDCAIRAIAAALDVDWDTAYALTAISGFKFKDIQNQNAIWGAVLRQNGFKRYAISNSCPDCYTAEDFARDHPQGTYVLGYGNHTATIRDGFIMDSWDSSQLCPQYFWAKEN